MAFWDSFASIGERLKAFWLCIGDFNFILVQSEKQGGKLVAGSSHFPFKRFIDHFGMVDLGYVMYKFNCTRQLHESIVIEWMCKYEYRTYRESCLSKTNLNA
jgi:hypothetical protein